MKTFLAIAAAFTAMLPASAAQASWSKSYVVSWYEPAMYFAGKGGPQEPGDDCPKGTNKEVDWVQVLVDAGYTREQATWLRDPANPTRDPVHGQNQMAFRGKNRENVYMHPTSTPEVGFPTVEGKIGEGFDLDGNPKTGFVSPQGQRGVDNNFYRAFGCRKEYRGPPRIATSAIGANDTMKNGAWTVVILVAGEGDDPLNDDRVTLGVYTSKDRVVASGAGDVNGGYTFRIQPDQRFEGIMKARTVNGRIVTEVTPKIALRSPGGGVGGYLELLQARAELQIKPSGELEGLIGGYTPWLPFFEGFVKSRGPVAEILGWIRAPDIFYALRRHADYSPTGPKGEKTHISYALRVFAAPAYVADPDGKALQKTVVSFKAIAPPPKPVPPLRFSKGEVVDGVLVPFGAKAEPLPEEMLLPPKPAGRTAD